MKSDKDRDVATYNCNDEKFNGMAIYGLNENSFSISQNHTIKYNDYDCEGEIENYKKII